ncbi:DUF4252 domain-containing protein [Sphingobacterium hotanense]|uniref:DUF4252 domain-containing protein n=1 Tax=Sphingobacterium hotanense TaxID=649196 RepID=A0ABT7NRZ6_9SPHI|nr:DUF4252 domain-containing protein [Sphingobacterium hotanense]MCT1525573.1 DUF4252 domain-containing protein [Sphingobacterium hotanense]MDM1049733.1 DUF4252 domain-containing protein [Sphingobacterium hotanense]
MKTIMLICALLFAGIAQAQVSKLDDIFEQYKEQKGVTSIKIGKPMFKMLNKMNIDDADLETIRPLFSKINSIKMLIVEGSQPTLKNAVNNAVDNLKFEELMVVNSEGNKIKFLAKSVEGDLLNNLLLSIVSDEDTIFMILDGAMSYDDINNLVNKND